MAVKKGGLGRGLDSLIPSSKAKKTVSSPEEKAPEKPDNGDPVMVKIGKIEPRADQPRKNFDEGSLKELADSIKTHGIIQPLIVQKENDKLYIVAGERRWRAARMAGITEVPVIIREYSKKELAEISLIENLQREDLNPVEEALAYEELIKEFKLTQDEVSKRVSRSRSAITNSLRLLKLPEEIREMLIKGTVSEGHARALLGCKSEEKAIAIARRVEKEGLSVRTVEALVKKPEKKSEKAAVSEIEELSYRQLEAELRNILGSKVSIQSKNNKKGTITIEYYSPEELERITDLLNKLR